MLQLNNIEEFAVHICNHFLTTHKQVSKLLHYLYQAQFYLHCECSCKMENILGEVILPCMRDVTDYKFRMNFSELTERYSAGFKT